MKDILLITNYWHFEEEKESSRYTSLVKKISADNFKVEVVTSNFYHANKLHRKSDFKKNNYVVTLIEEPGYKKNISLQRIQSHACFARNVIKYLQKRNNPDVIYCVIPSLEVAYKVSKYAKSHGIKIIIDIQDLWPEAFKIALNIGFLNKIVFYPMSRKANYVYKNANGIVAVSKSYMEYAKQFNESAPSCYAYLGVELDRFDRYKNNISNSIIKKEENEILLAYAGTLGYSYDLTFVLDAIHELKRSYGRKIRFIVMGDGPLREKFEKYADKHNLNVDFTGKLSYKNMVSNLYSCDIAINPIVSDSVASIINKHADYAAAGLPVINTQNSKEYVQLLETYNAGINVLNGSVHDLASSIKFLSENSIQRSIKGKGSRKIAEEYFDRNTSYKKIIDMIKYI